MQRLQLLITAGKIWVGTYNAGAFLYDGATWTVKNNTNGLPGNRINCITINPS
jgi:ligand-binding sensor domain-containing protein